MRKCDCDVESINLSFSLDYIPKEILTCRNILARFYEGGMSIEYLNSLTVEELLEEREIANNLAIELEKEVNNTKNIRNGSK